MRKIEAASEMAKVAWMLEAVIDRVSDLTKAQTFDELNKVQKEFSEFRARYAMTPKQLEQERADAKKVEDGQITIEEAISQDGESDS